MDTANNQSGDSAPRPIEKAVMPPGVPAPGSVREGMRHEFARLLEREPNNERAWLRLASLVQEASEKRYCLCNVLRTNPANRVALRLLRELDAELALRQPKPTTSEVAPLLADTSQPKLRRRGFAVWLVCGTLLVILAIFAAQAWVVGGSSALSFSPSPTPSPVPTLTPTATATVILPSAERIAARIPGLERAWQARDWGTAASLLDEIGGLDSSYPGLASARCDTFLQWAQDLVGQEDVQTAYDLYLRAVSVCDSIAAVQGQDSLAVRYLSGRWQYDHQQWEQAAQSLQAVYDADPGYIGTRALLYASYMAWGQAQFAQDLLQPARQAFEAALKVRPDDPVAIAALGRIRDRLQPPPTPTTAPSSTGKRIEVNISEQRMYVWQGNALLHEWVCSTGEPGRNTAAGRFRVLDKIPEAWASTWSLRMPYWLGIYQAGSLENGIHALPILPNGQTLWAGYLGTPVSYGCVILSTENAHTLYDWAEIGTPVWVHY